MDEDDGEIGTGFSVHVAQSWEQALFSARTPKTVKTALRTSMVLGWGANSVYPVLRRLVKCGLGGPQGNGRQRISWISESDFCRALEHLIQQPLEGPVNLAAPEVLTNRDWLKTMRATARQPIGLPAFRWMLEIGAFFLRTETELVLKSRWIEPKRLVESGFTFLHPKLIDAITALESNKGA